MHAELMEFNTYLQQRLKEYESISAMEVLDYPESNVKAHIPSAFLVGKKPSYHVYQVILYLFATSMDSADVAKLSSANF